MEIRRYESRDLEQIACLFYETVHTSHLNHIESQIKSEYLSVPSKAILLEERVCKGKSIQLNKAKQ